MRIDRIVVGTRRREDLGDLDGLVTSIRTYGLLHPIVVDADNRLVAGERRLRACERLGWDDIPVKQVGALTDAERREIELEENLRRKDLTPNERSRTMVRLAETAREISATEIRSTPERNPGGGRPAEVGSYRDVAERIGVPVTTVHRAEQHVAAVQKYPELGPLNGSAEKTVRMAAALDALPEAEREAAREKVRKVDTDTLNDLLGQPRLDHEGTRRFREELSAQTRWTSALNRLSGAVAEVEQAGGIAPLLPTWPTAARQQYADRVAVVIDALAVWHRDLRTE